MRLRKAHGGEAHIQFAQGPGRNPKPGGVPANDGGEMQPNAFFQGAHLAECRLAALERAVRAFPVIQRAEKIGCRLPHDANAFG